MTIIFKSDDKGIRRIITEMLKSDYYKKIMEDIIWEVSRDWLGKIYDEGYKDGFDKGAIK